MIKKLTLAVLAAGAALLLAVSAFGASHTYTVKMSGKSETPKGDPDGRGTAKITINAGTGKVCWRFTYSKIGKPTAAHIHKGKKGTAGPVLIPFFGGAPKKTGCVKADKGLLRKIVKSPGSYYVNIHNAKYPAGALRAQL